MSARVAKRCTTCLQTKPVEHFYVRTKVKKGKAYCYPVPTCKTCNKASARGRMAARPRAVMTAAVKRWKYSNPGKVKHQRLQRWAWAAAQSDGTLDGDVVRHLQEIPACEYCGEPLAGHRHLDHITPLSKGGQHSASNMAAACVRCNLKKGSKGLLQFVFPEVFAPHLRVVRHHSSAATFVGSLRDCSLRRVV